ncbi:MAG: hypothetical protein OXJ53_08045 [Gammaproteobacteria bacterium]|nr:hypothetical protein [Gammaproteobacteria bacterium]MDD9963311.1 hypothetical protein [Gammaproteobacteria bacterium]
MLDEFDVACAKFDETSYWRYAMKNSDPPRNQRLFNRHDGLGICLLGLLALTPATFAATTATNCNDEWLDAEAAYWCTLDAAKTTVENPNDGDAAICNLEITCPAPGVADLPQSTVTLSVALDCVDTVTVVDNSMTLGTNCPG